MPAPPAPDTTSANDVLVHRPSLYRVWVTFGLLCVVACAVTLGRWIASPLFAPAPVGEDPIPPQILLNVRIMEVLGAAGFLVALWFFLVAPLVRRVPIDANGREPAYGYQASKAALHYITRSLANTWGLAESP